MNTIRTETRNNTNEVSSSGTPGTNRSGEYYINRIRTNVDLVLSAYNDSADEFNYIYIIVKDEINKNKITDGQTIHYDGSWHSSMYIPLSVFSSKLSLSAFKGDLEDIIKSAFKCQFILNKIEHSLPHARICKRHVYKS